MTMNMPSRKDNMYIIYYYSTEHTDNNNYIVTDHRYYGIDIIMLI